MHWIELIRVRSSEAALRAVLPLLEEQVQQIATSTVGVETHLLQHALYEGDLAVVVVWQTDVPPAKSREGLMVANNLDGLGTVDHAVWRPVDPMNAEIEKRSK